MQRTRFYEVVAEQIRSSIASGERAVGERLPAERELAEFYGASRTVIREAVKLLRSEGLVDVRQGSGTYVREPGFDHVSGAWGTFLRSRRDPDSFMKLLEVREVLEARIAGIAAERASTSDCDHLSELIGEMERCRGNAVQYVEADQAFHLRLATVTHNEYFRALFLPITDSLLEFRILIYSHDPQRTVREGVEQHREILAAVRDGDAPRAEGAMQAHVQRSRELYARAILRSRPRLSGGSQDPDSSRARWEGALERRGEVTGVEE